LWIGGSDNSNDGGGRANVVWIAALGCGLLAMTRKGRDDRYDYKGGGDDLVIGGDKACFAFGFVVRWRGGDGMCGR